ncbi:GIY-YIG nuclease family protein [Ignavibacterium album]|uniref:GIY-YIG nuclease family protein n=1 Tax=Ignavibacterium album TaxID=591197 RepID=UPI0035BB5B09
MKKKSGYTYLICAEKILRFKIGCAKDYKRRFKELQSASPLELKLVAIKISDDMYEEEKKWHRLFKKSRVKGEWFDLSYEELYEITKNWRAKFGIHWRNRTVDNLVIGGKYFISFDGKKVTKVILKEKSDISPKMVLVESLDGKLAWSLYEDEVRDSKVAALFNYVTL